MKTDYDSYFKEHYKSTFSETDVAQYRQWFYAQWKIISKQINITPRTNVLEIGSGFGGVYSFLQEEGVKYYTGIELDKEITKFANRHFKTDAFKAISIEDLPEDRKFDVILAFEVLEHVSDPGSVTQKINRLLKAGGVFCATSPYPYKKNVLADTTHVSVLHPLNWKRLLERAGLVEITLEPWSFLPLVWRMHKSANIRLPFYVGIPGFISTCYMTAKKTAK